jgi:hypothetical protein
MVNDKTSDALRDLEALDREARRATPSNDERRGICPITGERVSYHSHNQRPQLPDPDEFWDD